MNDLEDNFIFVKNSSDEKLPIRIVITEGTSFIARSLAYRIVSDKVFGPDQEIILSFYDSSECAIFLESAAIEITACAPNLLKDIIYSTNPAVAFKDADVIFSIGTARDYNFEHINFDSDSFFKDSVLETKHDANLIELYAKRNAKVITLGNTAAKIISEYAPSIPKENITAVSLGLLKLAMSLIARKLDRLNSELKNLIIWGTNSRYTFPYCKYVQFTDGRYALEEISDDGWCKKTLPKLLENIFQKCRFRTSEALALADHCKYLVQGTPPGEWTCMSVLSDGSYDVTPGVFFSFPVYCKHGKWEIVKGLQVDPYCKKIIKNILGSMEIKIKAARRISQGPNLIHTRQKRSSSKKSIIKPIMND